MRLGFALIALGIALVMPAATKAQSWDEYRPKGGNPLGRRFLDSLAIVEPD
jgi:hypothetical protein